MKKHEIAQVIAALWEGDRLIVSELSRLGRSMLEIMGILSVAVEKGIRVYAVKGNWQLEGTLPSDEFRPGNPSKSQYNQPLRTHFASL